MTVRATYQIDDKQIDDMNLTITFTMTVNEWRNLMSKMPTGYEPYHLRNTIATALGDITKATKQSYHYPNKENN